ncbi:MAG: hypothetical protein K2Q18_07340 [Bdellovibrionales bacterium]|nr:hypothetical protein [Bdellovibrionales bacterium]
MMKTAIALTFMLSLNLSAQEVFQVRLPVTKRGRAPAVMDGTCNVDQLTTKTVIINGQSVVQKRPIEEIKKKELCEEVKKCMYSADEDKMPELRALEDLSCNTEVTEVTPKVPSQAAEPGNDGARKPKATTTSGETPPKETTPATAPR